MKRSKARDAQAITWIPVASVNARITSKTTQLVVTVAGQSDSNWLVAAITTPLKTKTTDDLFDDHAHEVIGHYVDLIDALAAGRRYMLTWAGARGVKCKCSAIERVTAEMKGPPPKLQAVPKKRRR